MKKTSWVLLAIFVPLFVLDLYSTSLVPAEILYYLETSPLYRLGGLPLIAIVNILFLGLILLWYERDSPFMRFTYISTMVWLGLARVQAIIGNLNVAASPPPMTEVARVTVAETLVNRFVFHFNWFYMPLILTIIIYLIFRIDNEVKHK